MSSSKEIIVSGIKPTGRLHIGNYLGAIKQWLELQKTSTCYFFIADWHALTDIYDPHARYEETLDVAASLLALGIDPKKCTLFLQSRAMEHTELCWVFNTLTPMALAERMTQYKDQSKVQKKNVNVGLFDYPILQAADILMYKADKVPVGKDQIQHVELTRTIARFFNNRYGKTFPEPRALVTPLARVMSLQEPTKKMSKSLGDTHCIYLDDTPDTIQKKLRRAVTDTGPIEDGKRSAGIENLFTLLHEFGTKDHVQSFEDAYVQGTIRYADLKDTVALAISTTLADFRKKKETLLSNPRSLEKILDAGAKKSQKIAGDTMQEVRRKMGLRSK